MFLMNNNVDVAILSEIWVRDNADCSMLGYNFYCKPRSDGYGGVGIYISKSIKFKIINMDSTIESIGIQTLNLQKNINIFSVY